MDGSTGRARTCVPLLVETFGGLSPALMHELRAAAEWRSNKLTSSEYDETTWSARTWLTFVAQRLSVAVQLSVAQEAAEALGLSVAADPRAMLCYVILCGERLSGGHRGLVLPT